MANYVRRDRVNVRAACLSVGYYEFIKEVLDLLPIGEKHLTIEIDTPRVIIGINGLFYKVYWGGYFVDDGGVLGVLKPEEFNQSYMEVVDDPE